MKTKLMVLLLLVASSVFAGPRVVVGIGVGGVGFGYAAPAPVVVYATPCPGPGYSWVGGYWYGAGPNRYWHAGYWAASRAFYGGAGYYHGGRGYYPRYDYRVHGGYGSHYGGIWHR